MKRDINIPAVVALITLVFAVCLYFVAMECLKQEKVDFISRAKIFCKNKSGLRSVEGSVFRYLAYCKNGDILNSDIVYFDQEAEE